MQQTEQATGWGGADRNRVGAVVETLGTLRGEGDHLAELAHDARNMVTALGLYCDLLEEPGVLATPYVHYGNELRLVAAASRRLVEKLAALDSHEDSGVRRRRALLAEPGDAGGNRFSAAAADGAPLGPAAGGPIDNLAGELLTNRNLLAALAGPSIALTVDAREARCR